MSHSRLRANSKRISFHHKWTLIQVIVLHGSFTQQVPSNSFVVCQLFTSLWKIKPSEEVLHWRPRQSAFHLKGTAGRKHDTGIVLLKLLLWWKNFEKFRNHEHLDLILKTLTWYVLKQLISRLDYKLFCGRRKVVGLVQTINTKQLNTWN